MRDGGADFAKDSRRLDSTTLGKYHRQELWVPLASLDGDHQDSSLDQKETLLAAEVIAGPSKASLFASTDLD